MPSTASLKCSGKTETEPSKSYAGAVISHRFANVARTVCEVMDRFTLHDLGVDVQHAASSLRLFRGHISTQTVYSSDLHDGVLQGHLRITDNGELRLGRSTITYYA
eukprot:6186117-Pleurochrysis_carterae.AAC.3